MARTPFLPRVLALAVGDAVHDRQRVEHVDAGRHVGRGVGAVELCHHAGEDVVPGHDLRTKVEDVGEEGGDHNESAHSQVEHEGEPAVLRLVEEQEKSCSHHHVREPGEIGEDEGLTEGDHPIQRGLNHVVVKPGHVLQNVKTDEVDGDEDQHRSGFPQIGQSELLDLGLSNRPLVFGIALQHEPFPFPAAAGKS
jgi:hypothetical protein